MSNTSISDAEAISLLEYYTGRPIGSSTVTPISKARKINILGLMPIIIETNYGQGKPIKTTLFPWQSRYVEVNAEMEDNSW